MLNFNQILKNWTGVKKLLVVFPHPDDETVETAGLLLVAKKFGFQTTVVTLTKGEAGKNRLKSTESLAKIREAELKRATNLLKIDRVIQQDLGDGQLKTRRTAVRQYLNKIIGELKSGIVVTYDHSGLTGHPDHISVSLVLKKVVSKYPEIELYWVTCPEKLLRSFSLPDLKYALRPDIELKLNLREWVRKIQAIKKHRSQELIKTIRFPLLFKEWYYKVNKQQNYPFQYIDFEI
jgi:LmbE family N-acetylglucosaminyl deacetylase